MYEPLTAQSEEFCPVCGTERRVVGRGISVAQKEDGGIESITPILKVICRNPQCSEHGRIAEIIGTEEM